MKNFKILNIILSLLLLSSMLGCDFDTIETKNSDTKINETYTSLISDAVSDEYSVDSEVDYWTGIYFEKEDMEDRTCLVFGNSYTGSYSKSIIDKMNSYTTDIYLDDNNIEFGLRSDTGELAYINFMNSDFFDTQPYLPETDDPIGTAISLAIDVASNYVDDINEYTQIFDEDESITRYKERAGKTHQITYHFVTFAKKINGYFSSDYITVKVTSKGTLASIMIGDIGAFDDITLDFDKTAMEQSISKKIESTYQESKLNVKKSNIDDQKIVLTPDGDICMYSKIAIYGVDDTEIETQTGIRVLTILKKAKMND